MEISSSRARSLNPALDFPVISIASAARFKLNDGKAKLNRQRNASRQWRRIENQRLQCLQQILLIVAGDFHVELDALEMSGDVRRIVVFCNFTHRINIDPVNRDISDAGQVGDRLGNAGSKRGKEMLLRAGTEI